MRKTWWKEAVVYQVYPRSFQDSNGDGIGDLPGVTSRPDYLKELGVDVIWLSPFYQSPFKDMGYDISDYRNIQPELGTLADFDEMLKQAHARGIRIVIDLVANHTSNEHFWFRESRKSKDNPYRDYYIWRDGKNGGPPNNWGSCFSGSAWSYDETTDQYYLHCFGDFQPDLNWENPKLRQEIYDMMRWWCERGVDGFRMDVISLLSKVPGMPDGPVRPGAQYGDFGPYVANGPRIHEFLQEMNREVLSRYDLLTVGECSGLTVEQAVQYTNDDGRELNMAFHFDHMDLDGSELGRWSSRRIDLRDWKKVLTRWQNGLHGKAWNSLYLCNHDQPRIVSRLGDDSDQESRERSAKAIALSSHMMEGTPYIFEGEELGMTNYPFESLSEYRDVECLNAYRELTESGRVTPERMMEYMRRNSRDNARTPVQWDDTDNAGFTSGDPWININPNYPRINAAEQMARTDSVFHFYQELIRLRHAYDIIVYGDFTLLLPEDKQIFAYVRSLDGQKLLTVCNLSGEPAGMQIPEEFCSGEKLIATYEDIGIEQKMTLRPWEAFAVIV